MVIDKAFRKNLHEMKRPGSTFFIEYSYNPAIFFLNRYTLNEYCFKNPGLSSE